MYCFLRFGNENKGKFIASSIVPIFLPFYVGEKDETGKIKRGKIQRKDTKKVTTLRFMYINTDK